MSADAVLSARPLAHVAPLVSVAVILMWAWLKTTAGAIKTAAAAFVGVIGGLLALDVAPMAGLLLFIAFEAVTDYRFVPRPGLSRWRRAKEVLGARVWVLACFAMGVVYANATGIGAVKVALVGVGGGALVLTGWYRAGTRAPILKVLADAAVARAKGHGLDLSLEDEEGRNVNFSARIRDAALVEPDAPTPGRPAATAAANPTPPPPGAPDAAP